MNTLFPPISVWLDFLILATEAVARRQQASICTEREILMDVATRRLLECVGICWVGFWWIMMDFVYRLLEYVGICWMGFWWDSDGFWWIILGDSRVQSHKKCFDVLFQKNRGLTMGGNILVIWLQLAKRLKTLHLTLAKRQCQPSNHAPICWLIPLIADRNLWQSSKSSACRGHRKRLSMISSAGWIPTQQLQIWSQCGSSKSQTGQDLERNAMYCTIAQIHRHTSH